MKQCKTCGSPLITKPTKHTSQKGKQYYYTAYYFCTHCKKIYLDNKFKVENTDDLSLFTHTEDNRVDVDIWTDGACAYNGMENAKAAWAFVAHLQSPEATATGGQAGKHEESGLVVGKQTNNTAEAYAIYHALLWASEQGYKTIRIHSDSQITINNLSKPVAMIKENREIFALISALISVQHLKVQYQKVPGHAGDLNNERADKLANIRVGIIS